MGGVGRFRVARAGLMTVLLAVSINTLAACASGQRRLPKGTPAALVDAAPTRTLALRSATVVVAAPSRFERATVDLRPPVEGLEAEAVAAIDLLRGVVDADQYGGQGVRGVSTLRLDVTVDLAKAIAATPPTRRPALEQLRDRDRSPKGQRFEASVWLDVNGRVRRMQHPTHPFASPPVTTRGGFVSIVTIDYFAFRVAVPG